MTRRSAFTILMILLSGCGSQELPLLRLERETPIDVKKLGVSQCQLYGEPLSDSGPMTVKRGDAIELTGVLTSGEISTDSIPTSWRYEVNERSGPIGGRLPNGKSYSLCALIYGSNPTIKFGLEAEDMIESRPIAERPSDFEFRASIKAPDRPGRYVFDLQAVEQSVSLQRGQKITKPLGTPFWRRELVVQ